MMAVPDKITADEEISSEITIAAGSSAANT